MDDQEDQEDLKRTVHVLKQVMCDLEPDLIFTTELPGDFSNNQIPTVDFTLWLEEGEHEEKKPTGYCMTSI